MLMQLPFPLQTSSVQERPSDSQAWEESGVVSTHWLVPLQWRLVPQVLASLAQTSGVPRQVPWVQ